MIERSNKTLVSVVIPTFGRTDFVEDAVRSVVHQTYENIEILICDDNCNNPEIRQEIKRIISKFPKCTLLLNKTQQGGAGNRNVGIQNAHGELISFLDDDDVYEPTRIEKVVNCYQLNQKRNVGIIYTHCFFTDEKLNILGEYTINPEQDVLFQHMCGCLCATSQWTVPKRVFERVGMFEITPSKQDSIMLLKILGEGYEALCVPEKLSFYRSHQRGRISEIYSRHINGELNYLKWLRKYYDKLRPEQQKKVEVCAHKRLLVDYSGMKDRHNVMKCLKTIIKNGGVKALSLYDIMYMVASPIVYRKIFHKLMGGVKKRPYMVMKKTM